MEAWEQFFYSPLVVCTWIIRLPTSSFLAAYMQKYILKLLRFSIHFFWTLTCESCGIFNIIPHSCCLIFDISVQSDNMEMSEFSVPFIIVHKSLLFLNVYCNSYDYNNMRWGLLFSFSNIHSIIIIIIFFLFIIESGKSINSTGSFRNNKNTKRACNLENLNKRQNITRINSTKIYIPVETYQNSLKINS